MTKNSTNLPKPFSIDSYRSAPTWIKVFLWLAAFDLLGFLIFIFLLLLSSILSSTGIVISANSVIALTLQHFFIIFFTLWGMIFAYTIPLGIISYGIWGVLYKESAIQVPIPGPTPAYRPTIHMKGPGAIVLGIFWLLLGLIILWAVNGIVLSLFCSSYHVCPVLPAFIKFF